MLGIVTPTYFWQLPDVFKRWLDQADLILEGDNYVFTIAACGTTTGAVSARIQKILAQKGIRTDVSFAIRTPDTWTPMFDLSDSKKNEELLRQSKKELEQIIEKIKNQERGNFDEKHLPAWMAIPSGIFYKKARDTSHFHVSDDCIGCGFVQSSVRSRPLKSGIESRSGSRRNARFVLAACTGVRKM